MALEIEWTKRADRKFDLILDYLQSEWGENATKLFVKKVYDFLDVLEEFPQIGYIEKREVGVRGFTLVKQVNIFYKIHGRKIILLDFFDNRLSPRKKKDFSNIPAQQCVGIFFCNII